MMPRLISCFQCLAAISIITLAIETASIAATFDEAGPNYDLDLPTTRDLVASQCESGTFSGVVLVRDVSGRRFEHVCGEDVDLDARFKIFSTSKPFTAAVVMTHVEAGRLSLTDRLGDHVAAVPAAWADTTIADLLQHRSGLPDLTLALLEAYQGGMRDHPAAMIAVLESHQDAEAPEDNPGWAYNNFGYELLTLVAESAGGHRFEDQTAALIFEPAGMTRARFEQVDPSMENLTGLNTGDLIQGFNGGPGSLEPAQSLSFVQRGAGALHMSAEDLAAYLEAYHSDEIVSAHTRQTMTQEPFPVSDTVGMGLGWFVSSSEDGRFISHSGGTNGYVSLMGYEPDHGVNIVILSNYGFARIGPIRDAILAETRASVQAGE